MLTAIPTSADLLSPTHPGRNARGVGLLFGGTKDRKSFAFPTLQSQNELQCSTTMPNGSRASRFHALTDMSEPGNLPDGQVLSGVESFQIFLALQTEQGR
jgi:hypothetical protein